MIICPKCGGRADLVTNPPRYGLAKQKGVCRECGHEWSVTTPLDYKRYGQ